MSKNNWIQSPTNAFVRIRRRKDPEAIPDIQDYVLPPDAGKFRTILLGDKVDVSTHAVKTGRKYWTLVQVLDVNTGRK